MVPSVMVDSRDELPTLIPCLACDGEYRRKFKDDERHALIVCRWCSEGVMDEKQKAAWIERKKKGRIRP